jgi:tetratricopeptide (TPR) repeat protein
MADQLVLQGQASADAGNYESAVSAWNRAADIYATLGDTQAVNQVSESLAKTLVQLERFDEAESFVSRRLTVAEDTNDIPGQITELNNLGMLKVHQREYSRAQDLFEAARRLAEESRDRAGTGLSLSNLGLVAWSQGDLETARDYYESAANYRLQGNGDAGVAHSTNRLGLIYQRLGQDGKALGAFLMARRISTEIGHLPTLVVAVDGLIDVYSDRGDLVQTQQYIAERMVLSEHPDATPEQQLGLFVQLGEYYELVGDRSAAEDAYQQALDLSQQLEDISQQVYVSNRLQALLGLPVN